MYLLFVGQYPSHFWEHVPECVVSHLGLMCNPHPDDTDVLGVLYRPGTQRVQHSLLWWRFCTQLGLRYMRE